MLLHFLTFVVSTGCTLSVESSPRNQPSNLQEYQVQLHHEIMNPFRASQLQVDLKTSTSTMMAAAVYGAETTIDGNILTTAYNNMAGKCEGDINYVYSESLKTCYNFSTSSRRVSMKYSFTSPTANVTSTFYSDDICGMELGSNIFTRCYFGSTYVYSPTLTLPKLPTEPFIRSA